MATAGTPPSKAATAADTVAAVKNPRLVIFPTPRIKPV
jgi:hypothetical protein